MTALPRWTEPPVLAMVVPAPLQPEINPAAMQRENLRVRKVTRMPTYPSPSQCKVGRLKEAEPIPQIDAGIIPQGIGLQYGVTKKFSGAALRYVVIRIKPAMKQMVERDVRAILGGIPGWCGLCLLLCGAAAGQAKDPGEQLQRPDSAAAVGASSDGGAIFSQRCSECHGDQGQGIAAAVSIAGPSLKAEHDLGHVMTAVETGPSHMPAFSRLLTGQQIRAVSGYVTNNLAVIPLGHGDIGEGGKLFRMYCATCHRTAVRGGVLAFAGRNAPSLTDKSPELIAGAIRWGPGTMPAFPKTVLNDEQLDSTVDYVRFVEHPPSPGGTPLKEIGPVAEGGFAAVIALLVIGIAGWIERGGRG